MEVEGGGVQSEQVAKTPRDETARSVHTIASIIKTNATFFINPPMEK